MKKSNVAPSEPHTLPFPQRRGLRIEEAAQYSGLSPFYIAELIRNGKLTAIGGPKTGVCAAYIVTREILDELLDKLVAEAKKRQESQALARSGS
jgi:hypothetical protein